MKYFIPLIASIFLFFSCKKDKVVIEPNYSQYEGSFYGEQNTTSQFGSSQHSANSDQIISTRVEYGKLLYSNTSFNIDAPNMTYFSYDASDYSHNADASFNNNFNDFWYSSNSNPLGGSGYLTESFSGARVQLPLTNGTEHPLKSQLEGQFILNIRKIEYLNGMDTTYTDTLFVQMSGFSAVLDNSNFSFGKFYSYLNSDDVNSNDDVHTIHNLFWEEDSIYINSEEIYGIFGGTADTIHYTYSGVHL